MPQWCANSLDTRTQVNKICVCTACSIHTIILLLLCVLDTSSCSANHIDVYALKLAAEF